MLSLPCVGRPALLRCGSEPGLRRGQASAPLGASHGAHCTRPEPVPARCTSSPTQVGGADRMGACPNSLSATPARCHDTAFVGELVSDAELLNSLNISKRRSRTGATCWPRSKSAKLTERPNPAATASCGFSLGRRLLDAHEEWLAEVRATLVAASNAGERLRPRAARAGEPSLVQQLGDLHRVERGALEQVVAHHEEVERVVVLQVEAHAADGDLVAAGVLERRGQIVEPRGSGRRAAPQAPPRRSPGARTPRAPHRVAHHHRHAHARR